MLNCNESLKFSIISTILIVGANLFFLEPLLGVTQKRQHSLQHHGNKHHTPHILLFSHISFRVLGLWKRNKLSSTLLAVLRTELTCDRLIGENQI